MQFLKRHYDGGRDRDSGKLVPPRGDPARNLDIDQRLAKTAPLNALHQLGSKAILADIQRQVQRF